jgi:hypothetical protein
MDAVAIDDSLTHKRLAIPTKFRQPPLTKGRTTVNMSNLPQRNEQTTEAYHLLSAAQQGTLSDALTTPSITALMLFRSRFTQLGYKAMAKTYTVNGYAITFTYDRAANDQRIRVACVDVTGQPRTDDVFTVRLSGIESRFIWGHDCLVLLIPGIVDGILESVATALARVSYPVADVDVAA